jgi:hypothetical protein
MGEYVPLASYSYANIEVPIRSVIAITTRSNLVRLLLTLFYTSRG